MFENEFPHFRPVSVRRESQEHWERGLVRTAFTHWGCVRPTAQLQLSTCTWKRASSEPRTQHDRIPMIMKEISEWRELE